MSTQSKHELKEPTVEECLAELREMFPGKWLFVADRITWPQGSMMPSRSVVMKIERQDAFFDSTPARCLAQVRQWKESQ